MNSKRVFYIMLGGIVILIGLCVAGTYFANKMILDEGNALKEFKLQDSVTKNQTTILQQAIKDIEEYEELEKIAKAVVPQEKDQARTVLELVNLAKESDINIMSVTFPESELGIVKKNTKSTDTKDKSATKNTPTADTSQLTVLPNLKGVYSMEITVTSDTKQPVSFDKLISYLQKLEKNRRTAQVSSIDIAPEDNNRSLITFTITLNSFVKPETQ
jgi:type II secretory pathway component PulM